MTIRFTRYVDVLSSAADTEALPRREFVLRAFTTNSFLPPNTMLDITEASDARDYFGPNSEEFARAEIYFDYVSNSATTPRFMSFSGYSTSQVTPSIIGGVRTQELAALQAFSAGQLTLTIGPLSSSFSVDLSGAASITAAMTLIEDAVQAANADPGFSAATVTYDAVARRVVLQAGGTGPANIDVTSTTAGFLDQLGWSTQAAPINSVTLSRGTAGDTITEVLTMSDAASDNFGSFLFLETLSNADIELAAAWNHAQNVKYIYCVPSLVTAAAALAATLANYSGTAVTGITTGTDDYGEMVPAILLASTDYDAADSVINYMFKRVSGIPVAVDDDDVADAMDLARVNYYGQTQSAGRRLAFYQRGFLLGPTNRPRDMNTYANEMWFKSAISTDLGNLQLGKGRISANASGILDMTNTITPVITDEGLVNGTVSVGRILSSADQSFIRQVTGNANAAAQVANNGYFLNVTISQETINQNQENVGNYLLVYAADEIIRTVRGRQVLV